jgi:phosphoribosylanthranilate isomerase
MTLVKICGITNLEDALAAVAAGADQLGFNFYRPSPRYIAPQDAREVIDQLPETVFKVGVFVNEESPETVRKIAKEAGIEALQLHGDESPEYCRALAADNYVIKTLAVSESFEIEQTEAYNVPAIMLDTRDTNLRGGTGRVFDWSVARHARPLIPRLYLAGGLSPENVAEAVTTVDPYAVDACSSLEVKPGRKSHERMRAFVSAVRSVKP